MLTRVLKVVVGIASAVAGGLATVLAILYMSDRVGQGLERIALPLLIAAIGLVLLVGSLKFLADGIRSDRALGGMKTCPQCAEEVKAAAKICRYCRYEFESE